MHGLTVLSLMTADGLNFIYGPCSIRQNDPGVVLLSGLDTFLEEIRDGFLKARDFMQHMLIEYFGLVDALVVLIEAIE